jgi:inward rectifier potassium channel
MTQNSQSIKDPGFGSSYSRPTKRIINNDGSFNVRRLGIETGMTSMYQKLLSMTNLVFLGWIFVVYLSLNFFFALLYYVNGIENLIGVQAVGGFDDFLKCFYFSVQTFTTVGYGAIAPKGGVANGVAVLEALTGLLSFSLATGLLYGRFSKPKAKLLFSENALVAPYRDGKGFMFRLVNKRENVLMDMKVEVLVVLRDPDRHGVQRRYFRLPLEMDKLSFMPLSWTVVHPIDADSPLYELDHDDFASQDAEILILVSGFDDTFNQIVHSRYSYLASEIIVGAKFGVPFKPNDEGDVVMNIHDIHHHEKVKL